MATSHNIRLSGWLVVSRLRTSLVRVSVALLDARRSARHRLHTRCARTNRPALNSQPKITMFNTPVKLNVRGVAVAARPMCDSNPNQWGELLSTHRCERYDDVASAESYLDKAGRNANPATAWL